MRSTRTLFHFLSSEISHFFASAKRIVKSSYFDILAQPKSKENGRLLIITPKRIGNAVQRNKVRRRLKSIFYENELFNTSSDYAIITKKPIVHISFNKLQQSLIDALLK